jgi:hypothetical protein
MFLNNLYKLRKVNNYNNNLSLNKLINDISQEKRKQIIN